MKKQADPLLLSLLEKIANPLTELDLSITLKGVYAPAEQWYPFSQKGNNPIKPIPTSLPTLSTSMITSLLEEKLNQEKYNRYDSANRKRVKRTVISKE